MDCDGSLDPRELPRLAALVTNGDAALVLGARVAKSGAWPWHARLANRALAAELRRRTSVELTDLGPMRVARRAALLDLGIRDRRFGWPLEMVIRAAAAGLADRRAARALPAACRRTLEGERQRAWLVAGVP